jgi:adenylyl-sulfate kinase
VSRIPALGFFAQTATLLIQLLLRNYNREKRMGRKGFTLWFTGLSGAGKTTLARLIEAELLARGHRVEVLDGDVIRTNLSKGLGFSKEDRDTNIRRIGFVCNLLTRNGVVAIAAAISPYRSVRDEVRRDIGTFVEVFVKCPIEVLAERDVKGLYKRALAGELKNFTGVDDPYEEPHTAEVVVETDSESPEASADRIIARLEELALVSAAIADQGRQEARRRLELLGSIQGD